MKVGVLFSGGKDSVFSSYKAKNQGHELNCLISVHSENEESYMFHTPSISKTRLQAELMEVPLFEWRTEGEKESELEDLREAIKYAKENYGIEGIVTGAVRSQYQGSRIQNICDGLGLEVINPLWWKNEFEYLKELLESDFKVILTAVRAYPFDKSWLGKEIDEEFVEKIKGLNEKYDIHPAGEGGEFETFVLNCPLFSREIEVKDWKDFEEGEFTHSREIEVS
ncbi:MAG: diphthine--ammonia ligase [Candidatus Pacearchaeota archaeon]